MSAVVVLTSAIGAVLLRSGAFLVSGWSGAMLLVCAVVFNVIDVAAASVPDYQVVPVHLAVGFLLVGLALAASGLLLSRTSPGHWPASAAGRRASFCRWTRMANGCRWWWQPSSARHS